MTFPEFLSPAIVGLGMVVIFFVLIIVFTFAARRRPRNYLREIPAFEKLGRAVGLAVEAGQRLHLSLGRGGIDGVQGASALVGLSVLERIARAASVSDRPPVATSGEATEALLSQDTLRGAYRDIGEAGQYDPDSGRLTGVTPFSYAAGVMPVIFDQQVSANVLAGHFGSEVALITDAGERSGSLTLAGSDSIPGQAILYATAQEPLIGEELYASGAYIQAGPTHAASLRVQDIFRWILVLVILAGAVMKFFGVLR
ncbi:MAG: hypothetical protein P8074_05790 [Anaerolineales bacterium]